MPRLAASARIEQELYDAIKASAKESGRSISAEAVWRAKQTIKWEKEFGSLENFKAAVEQLRSSHADS